MKKILVTGGAGFIGSHTVVELAQQNYLPLIVDNFSNSEEKMLDGIAHILGKRIECERIDTTNYSALKSVFEQAGPIDGVIHFAAYKAVGESVQQPLKYYHNNIESLRVLLQIMEEEQVSNLVFSSSCTVYGQPDQLPVTEATPYKTADSPYGFSKQICEQMIRDFARATKQNFSAALLRYFNPIGAHPSGHIGELPLGAPNNLVPYITQTAAGWREKLTVFGGDYPTKDGSGVRDFIHVVDLAKAHLAAFNFLEQQPNSCEAFNIGTGDGKSVLEVVQTFESETGQKLNYEVGPRRAGDIAQIFASSTKANEKLKWKTELDLATSLKDAWNWQKTLEQP